MANGTRVPRYPRFGPSIVCAYTSLAWAVGATHPRRWNWRRRCEGAPPACGFWRVPQARRPWPPGHIRICLSTIPVSWFIYWLKCALTCKLQYLRGPPLAQLINIKVKSSCLDERQTLSRVSAAVFVLHLIGNPLSQPYFKMQQILKCCND